MFVLVPDYLYCTKIHLHNTYDCTVQNYIGICISEIFNSVYHHRVFKKRLTEHMVHVYRLTLLIPDLNCYREAFTIAIDSVSTTLGPSFFNRMVTR